MLYNRKNACNLIGCLLNDLDLLRSKKYDIGVSDFEDMFHKIIVASLINMSQYDDIKKVDSYSLDNYLSKFLVQYQTYKNNKGAEFVDNLKIVANREMFEYCYSNVKKMSLLRKFKDVGFNTNDIYNESLLNAIEVQTQEQKLDEMSIEDIKTHFRKKVIEIEEAFSNKADSYVINVSENLLEVIQECKNGEVWGSDFQSKYFNTIFKGMGTGKLIIRSGSTGLGKTRASIGDMVNISAVEYYDTVNDKWVMNQDIEPSLFISTELIEKEIQITLLSCIAGVSEEVFKSGKFSSEEELRLIKAADVIKKSPFIFEFNSDFTIEDLDNIIVNNILNNKCKIAFFDYIQITPRFAKEISGLFGYTIREDEMLRQLASALKNICNRYGVCIVTSTQLNRGFKTDTEIDVTNLRGGMATADKADVVAIGVPVNKEQKEKIKHILESNFGINPTHAYHICKNRGGKWNRVIVWVNIDLDVIRVEDCFVTSYDYELLDIKKTYIKGIDNGN